MRLFEKPYIPEFQGRQFDWDPVEDFYAHTTFHSIVARVALKSAEYAFRSTFYSATVLSTPTAAALLVVEVAATFFACATTAQFVTIIMAQNGHSGALSFLAEDKVDWQNVKKLFRAAIQGHKKAQRRLGMLLQKLGKQGPGGQNADFWLEKAKEQELVQVSDEVKNRLIEGFENHRFSVIPVSDLIETCFLVVCVAIPLLAAVAGTLKWGVLFWSAVPLVGVTVGLVAVVSALFAALGISKARDMLLARQGSPDSLYELAMCAKGDRRRELFLDAAVQGHAKAQFEYASMLSSGPEKEAWMQRANR